MDKITKFLLEIKTVEEKFSKIQENPAMHGAENGLTEYELQLLDKLINYMGEFNIAGDAILKRILSL